MYQQNINLYLAPTADGRDAWVSTMRTIALEGRCFVVSSNMCVRDISKESDGEDAINAADVPVDAEAVGEPVNGIPETHPRGGGRRNSCFTEEGFEIALPTTGGPVRSRTERRRSVFDQDGHEIVLCGQDSGAAIEEEEEGARLSGTSSAKTKRTETQKDTVKTQAQAGTGGDFISRGGSCIVSPFGDVIAGPQWEDEEGIVYADVDFEDCVRGRLDLDVGGSYSRNDSFRFAVDGLDMDPLPYY